MAPKYTSTPIRYAGSGSGEKKMTIKKEAGADLDQAGKLKNRHITSNEAKERSSSSASSSKKEVLKHSTQHVSVKKERVSEKPREQGLLKSKTKSVNEDLAEKRKRLMQKLRNDEDDIIAEKAMKQEKKGKSFCFTTSDWFRSTIFGYLAKKNTLCTCFRIGLFFLHHIVQSFGTATQFKNFYTNGRKTGFRLVALRGRKLLTPILTESL